MRRPPEIVAAEDRVRECADALFGALRVQQAELALWERRLERDEEPPIPGAPGAV